MAREFNVIIERDTEGYYVASVPAVRGCHTQAKSLDELMGRVRRREAPRWAAGRSTRGLAPGAGLAADPAGVPAPGVRPG